MNQTQFWKKKTDFFRLKAKRPMNTCGTRGLEMAHGSSESSGVGLHEAQQPAIRA
jgi:hypothetical protein